MMMQENLQDNINKYISNINELLVAHESMVKLDADQNLLSRAVLSEYFYCALLNTLMGWELKNANLEEKNTPGIDLIDVERDIVVQVSLTCNHEKIQSSINKFQKPDSTSDWKFYFVPLKDDIPYFKKDFVIPKGVTFNQDTNVLTKSRIIQIALGGGIDKLQAVSDILDKLMLEQKNHDEICEYLSEVLKNKRENHPSFKLMAMDGIDEKLFTYPENEQLIPSRGIAGQKVAPIWELIKAEHKEGFHHIIIEGDGGIGKSVSLLSVTDDSELLSSIPAIYIHMYELCKDGKCISLTEYFKDNYSGFDEKISRLAAQPDQAGKPKLMLLLDGLNEIDFKLQYELIIKKIRNWTESHCRIQLIVASRPIPGQQLESILNNAVHIRLKPLDKECVKERLKTFGVTPPDDTSPIWETLKLPLFLTLYAKTANLPDHDASHRYPIVKREPFGPATIIWNYLQRELLRKEEEIWVLNCAFACEYISPGIAYRMALLNRFELSFEEANQFVDEAVSKIDTNILPEHLSNIAKKYIRCHRKLPTNNDFDWQTFVLDETGVFVEPKYKTDEKENYNYSFMHQSFRDCLAGLHLVNVAQMTRPAKEGGELPSEWKSSIPPLVLDYAAELMDADSAQKLWELNRKRCVKGAKIDNTSTYLQLELHGRLKTESGKLDFSGMDLRGMSLTSYMGGEYDLGLFASPELASGTYFDRKVFQSDGHHGAISCILSLDNGYIASGSNDSTIKIWDPNTGECIQTLEGHSSPVKCLTILPDAKLVSGSYDKTIKIWDTKSGKCTKTLKEHHEGIQCLAVLDKDQLVSCSDGLSGHLIRIWNIKSDKCKILEGHSEPVKCITVLPDGRIVSGSWDKTIKIWDPNSGKCTKTLKGHSEGIYSLVVLDNDKLVSASDDHTIRIWDTNKDECKIFDGHFDQFDDLARLNKYHLVSSSFNGAIYIWDANTGKCIMSLGKHSDMVCCIAILANGYIASGHQDKTIRLWNPETGKCIKTIAGYSNAVYSLTVVPNNRIVSNFGDNTIRIWNMCIKSDTYIKTSKCIKTLEYSAFVTCFTVLTDGSIVICSEDGTIQIWNAGTNECKILGKHFALVNCLAVMPNDYIASGSSDKTIKIWDPESGKCIKTLEGHSDSITCLAVFPDGRIISGSKDKTIKIWDPKEGKCIKTLKEHIGTVHKIVVLPNKYMVSDSFDRTIRVWDTATYKCIKTLEFSDYVTCFAISNSYIVSGFKDSIIKIWNIKEDKCVTLDGHVDRISCLAVLPDNQIASGSWDNTIKIWNLKEGKCINTLKGHSDSVNSLAAFTNGHLISGSADNTIRIWDPNTGECLDILEPTEVDVSKMDFSEAIMTNDTAKLLYQNGAIVPTSFIEKE